jgi:acyl dehydratase/NADP-dependent 3-hydroxy acid dehydrogenase YdfG
MMERAFSLFDQKAFAELSGDFNPLHVDPVAARRLLFGRPVVHGVHALLWALDTWLRGREGPVALRSINATFQTAIGVNESVRYAVKCENGGEAEIELTTDSGVAMRLRVAVEWNAATTNGRLPGSEMEERCCRERSAAELESSLGAVPLYVDPQLASRLFPVLDQVLPPVQLAEILATTRLVGMECPGLHSVYSGLSVRCSPSADRGSAAPELFYQVTKCDPRFSVVQMEVDGPTFAGTIMAFLRPSPQQQASFSELQDLVTPGEFAAQRALVVGGSRGLGEVTAKLLGAGGADVYVTYARGVADAQRVVDEIRDGGGAAACLGYDVLSPSADAVREATSGGISHLYYFATPFISGTKGSFSPELFRRFCDFYVTGFFETVRLLQHQESAVRGVLYPSSVFVEELPKSFGEYAAAKMAGETLCAYLEKTHKDLVIHRPRLPRVATDQTASLVPAKRESSAVVMLEHLRHLESAG